MKISTLGIDRLQTLDELNYLISFFQSRKISNLHTIYGFSCNLTEEEKYGETPVLTENLKSFVAQSEKNNILNLGNDEFTVISHELDLSFLFCHESNLEIETNKPEIIDHFTERWTKLGFSVVVWQNNKWEPVK